MKPWQISLGFMSMRAEWAGGAVVGYLNCLLLLSACVDGQYEPEADKGERRRGYE